MTPIELAEEGLAFLNRVLTEAYQNPSEKELRRCFIYRHARNISDLADDVLHLESLNRSSASRIVVRPMLESLFMLAAALKMEGFAAEKVVAEIEDEIERIKKWTDIYTDGEFQDVMNETINPLHNFAQQLRREHSVNGKKNGMCSRLQSLRN